MSRNRWVRLTGLILLSFALGFSYKYHVPKLESWLLVEIEKQSRTRTPIRIWAKRLNFHLVPLGVVLEEVKIVPQFPVDKYLAPAELKEVGARLAIWPLIRGELRLSQVFIRDSNINLFLRQDLFENKSATPMKFNFDIIYSLPIDEILLERVQIQGKLEPQNVVFRISDLNLAVENRYRSLFIDLDAPTVQIKPSGPLRPLNVALELRSLVEAKEAQISAFKLRADDSYLVASGRLNGDFARGKFENGAFKARTKLELNDVNLWEKVFFTTPRLPSITGTAEADLGVEMRAGAIHAVTANFGTKELQVDKFRIGALDAQLETDLKVLKVKEIEMKNNSGRVVLSDISLGLEGQHALSGKASVHNVDLHKFLDNIGVDKVPVDLPLTGNADCKGTLKEPFEIGCTASVSAPRAKVHSGAPKNTPIVESTNLRASGETRITLKDVSYKAGIEIGKDSKGSSNGVISYEDGFKINYTAERLALDDVKKIAGLKLEGDAKLTGSTEGTAKWATIDMNASLEKAWLEDWPLGEVKGKFGYKDGHLSFTGLSGQYGVSRYTGNVGVDLRNDQIRLSGQIPFADLRDIQSMFQRKFTIPIQVTGTGTGTVEAHGPFNFRLMTYTMRSSFFRGEIANESYDELVMNVKSTDGLIESERIHLTKSSGVAEVKGKLNPQNDIDLVVVSRSMRLEQSENVVALGLDLQGLADITMLIRGQLPKPTIELNGRLSRVVLADEPAEDSVFKLNFLSDRMEGSGQFFGSTLLSDFTYPYTDQAPFAFRLKARKWDFTTLFSLVSRSARQLDFSTSVTMDMAVQSSSGGFWTSDGQMQIDQFIIRKGGKQMAAEKPMYLTMRDGVINSNNFAITSGDSYVKVDLSDLKRDNLNASINGKVDLSLLGLFTPFISDLRGYMALSMDIRGSAMKPNISGSAYIERGYAKFADFYHPFSNVRADLLFNDNQILLNAFRADMASGKIAGDGKLIFQGEGKRLVDAKGTFTDVKINVPEDFRTNGSGTVAIKGDQFPYTMAIDYVVTGGEVISEFGGQSGDDTTIKASAYLPRFLYQEAFHPFTFAVDVLLKSPVLVNNSRIQANVTGQVKALGTPDRLSLDGTITPVPGGKVFFNDVPFEIVSAFVEYNNMPPDNPRVYLTANTRVTENVQDDQQRSTEHEYDVNLLVQGRVQPSPQITLSSQPPLNQREIVSLLALGVTAAGMDENRSSGFQASNTAAAGAAALLQKASGRKLKDNFGLDVKVSSSQPTPVNASQPKVTLSKQWTPKFGASASSTLAANPSNDVKLEYKMNKNISVIGSWEGKETNPETEQTDQSVFGLDLEYKVQFK